MQLRDAIDQLSTIRSQLAATEHLRSLRAIPVAFSGLLAVVAATAQSVWLPSPADDPHRYLALWLCAAVASAALACVMVARRALRGPGELDAANTWHAVRLFSPCLAVGAVCSWFVMTEQPQLVWLLPGLWQLLFGMGNLATARLLPAPAGAVGCMFLVTGASCLWLGERALAPWAMGLPFAAGQLALAAILWWHNERAEVRA